MWDERYQTPEYIFGDQPCQWLIMNQHRLPQSGQALALGDGEGRNGVFLAELGLEVTSVDLSEVGLRKARDLATRCGVTIQTVQADLEHYEIEVESQDLIVSIYCHLPDAIRKLVHERAEVALKPGGLFILEAFHHSQLKYQSGGRKPLICFMIWMHYLMTFKRYRYWKHLMVYAISTKVLGTQESATS